LHTAGYKRRRSLEPEEQGDSKNATSVHLSSALVKESAQEKEVLVENEVTSAYHLQAVLKILFPV
jgi:hypothetical protein